MNSQRTNENKNKSASAVFTKETLGVVVVLFATLCLICLITGDAVFSAPGKYVKDFLIGVFGYFAFPAVVYAVFKGVLLIIGKKLELSFKRKALIVCAIATAALFSHVLSMGGGYATYGEYISASYSRGESVYSAGGVAAAIVAYFLQSLLTVVGSAVVIGVLFGLSAYFLVADVLKGKKNARPEREFRSSFVKNETPAEEVSQPAPVSYAQAATGQSEKSAYSAPAETVRSKGEQRLFINNVDDFSFKTKREIAKDKDGGSTVRVDSSVNSLNVSSVSNSYSDQYNRDLQKKIEYVKTPAKIEIEEKPVQTINRVSQDRTADARVSDFISARKDVVEERTEDKAESVKKEPDIPMIEHDDAFGSDAKSRAVEFGERYAAPDLQPSRSAEFKEEKEETEEKITEEDLAEAFSISEETETRRNAAEELSRRFEGERIDRAQDDLFEGGRRTIKEPAEEPETPPVDEEPPAPRVRNERVRNILFEDEKPAFTSRVQADDNGGRRRFTMEETEEPVSVAEESESAEEKPQKPPVPINREYFKPPLDLLETYAPPADAPKENHEERVEIIRRVLEDFHISVEPQGYVQGPTITRYEVKMPAGITVKKVLAYDDDLKMRLQSKAGVRIEAPIPGKDLVGIEVANKTKITVGLKEVIEGAAGQKVKPSALMFAIGKDIVGNSITDNLAKGPHYLVAGATGSGKSVCLNVMIISMLMRYSPEELRLILIDPKRVGFRKYEHLPHLMIDEIITEPQKAVAVLQWAYKEMERRYDVFAGIEGGLVSDIESYNELIASDTVAKMPRIVIVVDELADLMETCKKDMEAQIRMLAQKARAAGIHLVLATQRPSVDVVTGTIKANLPSRIALKVMNFADSNTILSEGGAEKLLGNGDMLYKNSSMSENERYQGAWISDREISNIVTYIKEKNKAYYDDDLKEFLDKSMRPKQEETAVANGGEEDSDGFDEFFLKALWLAVTSNSVSISQLQRRFQIGYARAGGLVDKMERLGFVSGNEGSKARRVLITREEFENRFGSMPDNY
ncbi:MAG: hypothetical protein IJU83_03810 [Clostridia bacterium]|nr:hypothetical protein [Clostridia bacterium]